tara:strand:- start:29 stop:214 length:186 start_codon:yes stop_codon:yes gene_type:complete
MYHIEQTDYERYDKQEKQFKRDDARMKYGKNFKDFMDKKETRLRPGEVKKFVNGKLVSNKD